MLRAHHWVNPRGHLRQEWRETVYMRFLIKKVDYFAPGLRFPGHLPPIPPWNAARLKASRPGCRVEPAGGAMKTIEVSQDALTEYIYRHCPNHFYNWQEGECCRRKVDKETCSLHVFAGELRCPLDCSRLNTKEYGCDKGRCPRVKAVIKQLKA